MAGLRQCVNRQEDNAMEREIDRNALILREDENLGSVQIADDVVVVIKF